VTLDTAHVVVERIGVTEYREARGVLGDAVANWFTITGGTP